MPECLHVIHSKCLAEWFDPKLKQNGYNDYDLKCPLCRIQLKTKKQLES